MLSADGSSRPCWEATMKKVWKACWATAGARQSRRLSLPERVAQIDRAWCPIVEHRSTRWPAMRQLHRDMAALQRRLVAISLRLCRRPGEEPRDFVRRRGWEAAKVVGAETAWLRRQSRRLLDWHEHLRRDRAGSWAAKFAQWRGAEWLQQRRADRGSSALAGLTGSRRPGLGGVHTRWCDSLRWAREALAAG